MQRIPGRARGLSQRVPAHQENIMKNQVSVLAVAVLGAATSLFASPAQACGMPYIVAGRLSQAQLATTKLQAIKTERALDSMDRASAPRALASGKAVVGMWHFTFTSLGNANLGIPDGAVMDAGFQTWHSDGTEITNSSRPPITQSFCTGVWDYDGRSYRLNHYALSWDPTGTQLIGPTNIRERVSVDTTGNAISGHFSIDQYAQDGTTVLVHLDGLIDGKRVTVH
jgi:hypothetical protein